jgi:protein unc-45
MEYVIVFSVVTSIFTIRGDVGAEIFLQEGFLEEILEDTAHFDDEVVHSTLLELLSAATVDKNCRVKIAKAARGFLEDCAHSTNTEKRALSSSILAKLLTTSTETPEFGINLLKIFNDASVSKSESALLSAIEGLAFSSTVAKIKEELVNDATFLPSVLGILKSPGRQHPLIYGCLSILVNLTIYKPTLTEEEKRVNEIRRLAKEADVQPIDELDNNTHVTTRCKAVVAVGLLPSLNVVALNASPTCTNAIAHILLSVSTAAAHRGLLAQQGAIKLILALLGKPIDEDTETTLSNALAKILISVNPALIFSSRTPITAPVPPLTKLLTNESLPNELPRFESLLALTNLASVEDSARNLIVDKAWTVMETLLLSDIPLLQRATTELVCNLVTCQKGAEKFCPSKTTSATSRLHLLLALADVEDVSMRRAAGGALATLTDLQEVCTAIAAVERGLERIIGMLEDEDEDTTFRGIICVGNLVVIGHDLKEILVEKKVSEKVRVLIKRTPNSRLKNICDEVLAQLS